MRTIVVATTLRDERRSVLRAGIMLARRAGARLAVFVTLEGTPPGPVPAAAPELEALRAWLATEAAGLRPVPEVHGARGLPAIEATRFAEVGGADLLVVERTSCCREASVGSADAVMRRSRVPCLLLDAGWTRFAPVLAALDGTERGLRVFGQARAFADLVGAPLSVVTVDPSATPGPVPLPAGRALQLGERLLELVAQEAPGGVALLEPRLAVRGGPVVEGVLAEVTRAEAGVLVLGVRLGGPADRIPETSVARRLAQGAPCAVLTVPL